MSEYRRFYEALNWEDLQLHRDAENISKLDTCRIYETSLETIQRDFAEHNTGNLECCMGDVEQ